MGAALEAVDESTPDEIVFNGVELETGKYLFPAQALDEIARTARDAEIGTPLDMQLERRNLAAEEDLGAMFGVEPENLSSAGWAVVTAESSDPVVLEALQPLRDLRRLQAGDRYRELTAKHGESVEDFLVRHGTAPGPANPIKLPYYLLLVGDPESIPFEFQYQLDVDYAVGRLCFDAVEQYQEYARTVVASEASADEVARTVHLFGPQNPGDQATALSSTRLLQPLAEEIRQQSPGTSVATDIGASARRDRLLELLRVQGIAPAVLFTASHGLGTSGPDQRLLQGALLCQEWNGALRLSARVDESEYLAGDQLQPDQPVRARVMFSFACYSAGTPRDSDFSSARLAQDSFVADLPQRLLGTSARGMLAYVGHVDRAFSCSFLWKSLDPQVTAMASTALGLLAGQRVGSAMEYLNSRYASVATLLNSRLSELRKNGKQIDDATLTALWTASHDARNFVVLGDPAMRAVSA